MATAQRAWDPNTSVITRENLQHELDHINQEMSTLENRRNGLQSLLQTYDPNINFSNNQFVRQPRAVRAQRSQVQQTAAAPKPRGRKPGTKVGRVAAKGPQAIPTSRGKRDMQTTMQAQKFLEKNGTEVPLGTIRNGIKTMFKHDVSDNLAQMLSKRARRKSIFYHTKDGNYGLLAWKQRGAQAHGKIVGNVGGTRRQKIAA